MIRNTGTTAQQVFLTPFLFIHCVPFVPHRGFLASWQGFIAPLYGFLFYFYFIFFALILFMPLLSSLSINCRLIHCVCVSHSITSNSL